MERNFAEEKSFLLNDLLSSDGDLTTLLYVHYIRDASICTDMCNGPVHEFWSFSVNQSDFNCPLSLEDIFCGVMKVCHTQKVFLFLS